jgi:DNA gyrase subunit A
MEENKNNIPENEDLQEITEETQEAPSEEPNENSPHPGLSILRDMVDWLETFAFAFAFVIIVFTFMFKIVTVEGRSMHYTLDEGDKLIFVGHTTGEDHILIGTKNGYAARFHENKVTVVGRTARGVRGIDLREGDIVCGAVIVDNEKKLLTITENGYGKKSSFDEFEPRNRGIMGVIIHNINDKTGALAGVACVSDDDDVMIITNEGVIIRTDSIEIPTYKRSTTGVRVMKLNDGQSVANMTLVKKEDESAEEVTENTEVVAETTEVSAESSTEATENNGENA